MKKLIKRIFKIALPLLFGMLVMVWVYRDFNFSTIGHTLLHEVNWWWMITSLIFGVFSHILRGWRWKLALEPLNAFPRRSNCVDAVFISYGINLITPRLGEISRCSVLSKYDNISFSKSLGTVVTERLIDSLFAVLLTAAALFIQMKVFKGFFMRTGTDIDSITNIFQTPHFYIILFSAIGVGVLLYLLIRTLSFFERVKGIVLNVWNGIISLKDVKNKSLFVCYTLLIWLCYYMQFYIAFFCFDFTSSLSPIAGLVMFVAGSIAVVVPTPNGAGPWHFAITSMMILYGVSAENSAIFALIVHGVQTFLLILLGIYGSISLSLTNKNQ